jgi:hypothetical protein
MQQTQAKTYFWWLSINTTIRTSFESFYFEKDTIGTKTKAVIEICVTFRLLIY